MPAQFMTPSPSTLNDIHLASNDSDSSTSSSGLSGRIGSMDTSDDGGSTSSRQTPPEYPSPTPPSNSPPITSASLEAESPIGDEYSNENDVDDRCASSGEEKVNMSGLCTEDEEDGDPEILDKMKDWIVQQGYNMIPFDKSIKLGAGMVFVHVIDTTLRVELGDNEIVLDGYGSILMMGKPGQYIRPFPFHVPHGIGCYQFADGNERLTHIVFASAHLNRVFNPMNVTTLRCLPAPTNHDQDAPSGSDEESRRNGDRNNNGSGSDEQNFEKNENHGNAQGRSDYGNRNSGRERSNGQVEEQENGQTGGQSEGQSNEPVEQAASGPSQDYRNHGHQHNGQDYRRHGNGHFHNGQGNRQQHGNGNQNNRGGRKPRGNGHRQHDFLAPRDNHGQQRNGGQNGYNCHREVQNGNGHHNGHRGHHVQNGNHNGYNQGRNGSRRGEHHRNHQRGWQGHQGESSSNNGYFENIQQFPPLPSQDQGQVMMVAPQEINQWESGHQGPVVDEAPMTLQRAQFPSPDAPEFHPQGFVHEMQMDDQMVQIPNEMMVAQPMMNGGMPMQGMVPNGAMVPVTHGHMQMQPMMPPVDVHGNPIYSVPPPQPGMIIDGNQYHNNWNVHYPHLIHVDVPEEALVMKQPTQQDTHPAYMMFGFDPVDVNGFLRSIGLTNFIQIDDSEIQYHATVKNQEELPSKSFLVEIMRERSQTGQLLFEVFSLQPNTRYTITMCARMDARKLRGPPTKPFEFRTAPGRPDPPKDLRNIHRGLHYIKVAWKAGNNNGSLILYYHLELFADGCSEGQLIESKEDTVEILNLKEHTAYEARITAFTALGESLVGLNRRLFTKGVGQPKKARNLCVFPVSHRSFAITWDEDPTNYYDLEMYNCSTNVSKVVRKDLGSYRTTVGELPPSTLFHFRVKSVNNDGECWSEVREATTQRDFNGTMVHNGRTVPIPHPASKPEFVGFVDGCPKMSWGNQNSDGSIYTVQGATKEDPNKYINMYQGPETSIVVLDTAIRYMQVLRTTHDGIRCDKSVRGDVTRDSISLRPDRVQDVKLFFVRQGVLLVQWTPFDTEKMFIPNGGKIVYYVQRRFANTNSHYIAFFDESDQCELENIPGETEVTVYIRAAIHVDDSSVNGDWSLPARIITPRSPPVAVHNVKFDSNSRLLSWESFDQCADLQFSVNIIHTESKRSIMKLVTTSRNVIVEGLQPGDEFSAIINATTNVGKSPVVAKDFSIPALRPSTPVNPIVQKVKTNEVTVAFKASEPNGSPEDFVRPEEVEINGTFKHKFQELKANTNYTVSIAAKNAAGISCKVEVPVQTRSEPPVAPTIQCRPDAYQLRLSWDDTPANEDLTYKLSRFNPENQQSSTVYQGDDRVKIVKNLKEDTKYFFTLVVTNKISGAFATSRQTEFRTKIAPPPTIKRTPIIVLKAGETHTYLVEWEDHLPEQPQYDQVYWLQVSDATIDRAPWVTVYSGKRPSYEVDTKDFSGALHVRVLCYRSETMKGSPSPVGYISNIPPEVPREEEPNEAGTPLWQQALAQWFRDLPASVVTVIIMCIFVIFSVSFTESPMVWLADKMNPSSHNYGSASPSAMPPH
ncbi:hypothetical protein L3Y34_011081 [Caenorhabditis briggsae]|uniref:Fibronectin type-III domain-containing protein n=1 Tax=Caenorhabditis briggsae TaxID=6238 RepID=A0AAE9CUI7_CAEBR|nr:hypothetical protein L3Y34_011081 [Caenorhabditis briggsae]